MPKYLWTWNPPAQGKSGSVVDFPLLQAPDKIHIVVVGDSPGLSLVWESPSGQATKLIRGATLTKAGR
jgi:hypothetical protein